MREGEAPEKIARIWGPCVAASSSVSIHNSRGRVRTGENTKPVRYVKQIFALGDVTNRKGKRKGLKGGAKNGGWK